MLAKNLISDVIPTLLTSDTGAKALQWMDIFRISHLPIVNNNDFLGLISDSDIYDLNKADEPVENHKLSLIRPFVHEDQHIFEVIALLSELKLTVVPVLDQREKYIGLITVNDLLLYFSDLAAMKQPGSIIVLELNERDYSLPEISQIVESNHAKILSLYISSPKESTKLELTIKINKTDITSIIQTFERYDYMIKASFLKQDVTETLYEERLQSFLRYLNT